MSEVPGDREERENDDEQQGPGLTDGLRAEVLRTHSIDQLGAHLRDSRESLGSIEASIGALEALLQ